jgi:hypothetical protein
MAGRHAILRFKITLKDIKPPIWRRIEIPANATFWAFHVAIQDAMGWLDCHLHEFNVTDQSGDELRIGIPEDDGWGEPAIPGWQRKLSPIFRRPCDKALYLYDFGDGWRHMIVLESIESARPGVSYPLCLAGRRRCPPEDCGGPSGYDHLLEVLADPEHEQHAELLEWVGGRYDAEAFEPSAVVFDDPKRRLEFAFSE